MHSHFDNCWRNKDHKNKAKEDKTVKCHYGYPKDILEETSIAYETTETKKGQIMVKVTCIPKTNENCKDVNSFLALLMLFTRNNMDF